MLRCVVRVSRAATASASRAQSAAILPQSTTVDILAQVQRAQTRRFARRGLPQYRRYIDNIQERLGRLHQQTAQCWFNVQTTA